MSRHSHGNRKDSNHAEIKKVFEEYHFDVIDTSDFLGEMLDLHVSLGNHFFNFIEIKDGSKPPSQRALTKAEKDFIKYRPDNCQVIETVNEARAFCAHAIAGRRF